MKCTEIAPCEDCWKFEWKILFSEDTSFLQDKCSKTTLSGRTEQVLARLDALYQKLQSGQIPDSVQERLSLGRLFWEEF